jgi:RNA 2',3'-cyclic 3'-phosphodiesterase
MRTADFHRYFLCFRPDAPLRAWLAALARESGQGQKAVSPDHLHLTLCVLAETPARERFTETRISAALAGARPPACPVPLSRLRTGSGGATLFAGGMLEVRAFRHALLRLLAQRGLAPCRQPAVYRPHVTLGRDWAPPSSRLAPMEWIPRELVLIESEVGRTIHHVRGRWPLPPPLQGLLPFGPASPAPLRLAVGGRP